MKDRSTISEEDEEILIKRISMTEDAHKIERDKANKLEDVRMKTSSCNNIKILIICRSCEN